MINDPYSYDRSEFAEAWLWATVYWNMAESKARWLLHGLLDGNEATLAIVSDMGARSLKDALISTSRTIGDKIVRSHIEHFSKGFGVLGEHRNLYVHGLISMDITGERPGDIRTLEGRLMLMTSKGKLRFLSQALPTKDVDAFKDYCLALVRYGEAILRDLGIVEPMVELEKMLDSPTPSLDKPVWPNSPTRAYHSSPE
jgi:hypothetical protein